jgi:hypothetical protein
MFKSHTWYVDLWAKAYKLMRRWWSDTLDRTAPIHTETAAEYRDHGESASRSMLMVSGYDQASNWEFYLFRRRSDGHGE